MHYISLDLAAYLGMRTSRPKQPLEIPDEDRAKLNLMARRPKTGTGHGDARPHRAHWWAGDEQLGGCPETAHHRCDRR